MEVAYRRSQFSPPMAGEPWENDGCSQVKADLLDEGENHLMRIAIDARLSYYVQGGITQYTLNLIRALAAIDRENEYLIFQRRPDQRTIVSQDNFRRVSLWAPTHHPLEQYLLGLELRLQGRRIDVLHCTDFIPPFYYRKPTIITVHDLAFLLYPHFLTRRSARYYGLIDRAVRRADHIIAVSESTKRDIVRLTGTPEHKITVIYEAAEPIYFPIHDQEVLSQIHTKYHLPEQYILFVGTIEPRKNLPTLIRAFKGLLDKYRPPADLVVVGKTGWLYDDVYQLVADLGLGERVHFLGRVPTTDLPHLYNASQMLVLPSYYEGFGLPPLEAMACGVPVIVADTSAMPEVVGDAALRVACEDVEGFTVAMWRLLTDDTLRADMIAKGLKRVKCFSWERAAQETLQLYRGIVEQRAMDRTELIQYQSN
jgi:glycosyltransferase involved in cell wall biosynthesis